MEQNDVSKIIKNLIESRNKVEIIKNLSSLRGFVSDKKQFTIVLKHGGIGAVTGCLRKFPNSVQIVTISLSILGNCCIERDCAKEVIKHNGILILSDILKNFANDSIICRTFRIIGNIAQFDNYASEVHKYKIVPVVVEILNKSIESNTQTNSSVEENVSKTKENKITMGTKAMAVRVLRILWNSYSNRENMIQDGAIRSVSLVLIKYTEKWVRKEYPDSARKEMEKFLDNILKALLIFSKMGTAECAKQILADGNGFKTLVSLIPINPYVTVKCLTNLSHVATSRSDIANTEAVNCIVKRLKEYIQKHPNERYPNDVVSAFCLFFKHPLNCSEVKKAGGLQLILKMLKNCKSKRQEYMMTAALSSLIFDKKEEDILKSNGVIEIAISCIERNLKSKEELDEKHDYVKRNTSNILLKCSENRAKRKYMRDRSPSEESSPSSSPKILCTYDNIYGRMTPPDSDSSPPCSPRMRSPTSEDFDTEFSDDSENYSPLCSDFEDNENIDEATDKDAKFSEPESEKDIELDNININTNDVDEKVINMLLGILTRLVYKNKIFSETNIVSKKSMTVLLKYARECKNPTDSKITKLLWNIISDAENLFSLIQNDVIKLIYSLTEKQHDSSCAVCYRLNWTAKKLLTYLSVLAESDLGKLSIINILQNGNNEEKFKCVINVPFMIKFKPILLKVMETYDGLNMLLRNFEENSDSRYDITITLNKLSRAIHLNGPMIRFFPNKPYLFENKYQCDPSSNDIVTIKLDDGSTIDVDREFLIEQTHYFKVMLTGSFSESNQEVITLKNVSNEALQCLLNLLKVDLQTILPQPLLNVSLLTVLEVLVLTDLYLLEKLTDWLSTCVMEYYLTVDTASDIYNWSITSGTNLLRVETVAFILTFKMKDKDRHQLFENIVRFGLMHEIKDDVHNLISRYLKIR